MSCAKIRYVAVIYVLLRIVASVLPTSVVLEKINSHDAEMHSKDHAKGLKWQKKESIAQAVSVLQ